MLGSLVHQNICGMGEVKPRDFLMSVALQVW